MNRAALLLLLTLAACASAPAPPPPDPTPKPHVTTAADVADARAALVKACPPAAADDLTPGLSHGARSDEAKPHRWCPSLPTTELQTLDELLRKTPRGSPDRPKILSRIALIAFTLERSVHEDCRRIAVAPEPPPEGRTTFVQEAQAAIRSLYALRGLGEDTCTRLLHEGPETIPAICAR